MSNDPEDNDRPCDSGFIAAVRALFAPEPGRVYVYADIDPPPTLAIDAFRARLGGERPEGSAFNDDFWDAVDRER